MLGSLNVWDISRVISPINVCVNLMVKANDLITISPDRTVERAAAMMTEHKIGRLPVVESGDLVVGIVTESDLLRSYQERWGCPAPECALPCACPTGTANL